MKKIIYSKYSNERNHCLAIRTDILEDEEGVRYVRKLPEFPEGKLHVEAIYHWYEAFSRALEGTKLSYNVCSLIPGGVELEYLTGETLEEHLLSVEKKQGIEPCAEELLDYLEFVKSLHKGASFEITEGFREVFGEHELPKEPVSPPCEQSDDGASLAPRDLDARRARSFSRYATCSASSCSRVGLGFGLDFAPFGLPLGFGLSASGPPDR